MQVLVDILKEESSQELLEVAAAAIRNLCGSSGNNPEVILSASFGPLACPLCSRCRHPALAR